MNKNFTFCNVPVGDLFVTGPGDTVFIKLDNENMIESGTYPSGAGVSTSVPGGYCRDVATGERIWIPAVRCVHKPTREDFDQMADKYQWKQIAERPTIDELINS